MWSINQRMPMNPNDLYSQQDPNLVGSSLRAIPMQPPAMRQSDPIDEISSNLQPTPSLEGMQNYYDPDKLSVRTALKDTAKRMIPFYGNVYSQRQGQQGQQGQQSGGIDSGALLKGIWSALKFIGRIGGGNEKDKAFQPNYTSGTTPYDFSGDLG
jgi:hypothetical protein